MPSFARTEEIRAVAPPTIFRRRRRRERLAVDYLIAAELALLLVGLVLLAVAR